MRSKSGLVKSANECIILGGGVKMIEKYEFDGKENGERLLILAAVHGNETAGTNACNRIIDEFKRGGLTLQKGHLTIVPVCNPEAYRRDVRSIDENLNRVMMMHEPPQSYEQKLANEICPLIKNHRVVLDLHSTHCVGDVPFAFCDYPDEYNRKLIDALAVDFVLEGWPEIYGRQEAIQDFSTEQCAHAYGNTATTLECGYHKDPAAIELAYQAIINTLAVFEMIDLPRPASCPKKHIRMDSYVLKTREGRLCHSYKHLDPVCKGDKIAVYDDGEALYAPADGFILLPNLQAPVNTEWYYLGTALSGV